MPSGGFGDMKGASIHLNSGNGKRSEHLEGSWRPTEQHDYDLKRKMVERPPPISKPVDFVEGILWKPLVAKEMEFSLWN